jgi:hypothetical protein
LTKKVARLVCLDIISSRSFMTVGHHSRCEIWSRSASVSSGNPSSDLGFFAPRPEVLPLLGRLGMAVKATLKLGHCNLLGRMAVARFLTWNLGKKSISWWAPS